MQKRIVLFLGLAFLLWLGCNSSENQNQEDSYQDTVSVADDEMVMDTVALMPIDTLETDSL
ncbi:MAG: hypothetical protein KDD63_05285 [Bacteroidetes bacterium]|nr:hypothetical protein [Bacteroidota bacterium]MCB0851609.1 hypothetical protein [Bacteroidota bacterium]